MGDSGSDDEILPIARVTRLITGCEEFVETRVSSLQKEQREHQESTTKRLNVLEQNETDLEPWFNLVEELRKDNEHLKTRVEQLEGQVNVMPRCRCTRLLYEALTKVGPILLEGDPEFQLEKANQGVSRVVTDPLLNAPATETHSCDSILNTKTPPTEMIGIGSLVEENDTNDFSTVEFESSTSTPIYPLGLGLKRSHTATFIENFEDLPEPVQNKLRRFYSPRSSRATKEKLSDTQRALVDCYVEESMNKEQSPADTAKECMVYGVEEKIWPEHYQPTGVTTSFKKYLTQRIKNKISRDALRHAETKQKTRFLTDESRLE